MEKMFLDKLEKPNDEMLLAALGRSYKYWELIKNTLNDQYGKVNPQWKYYGAKSGVDTKNDAEKEKSFLFRSW